MIRPANALTAVILQLLMLLSSLDAIASSSVHKLVQHQHNATANASAAALTSPWLNKVEANWRRRPRPTGCRFRPRMCRQGEAPRTRMRCCRNRCVDVSSDVNNCGACGLRCRFSWQCCRGRCSDTLRSASNCGRCGHRCSRGVRCTYGLCGYAQPLPPPRQPPVCPPTRPLPPRQPPVCPPRRPRRPRPPRQPPVCPPRRPRRPRPPRQPPTCPPKRPPRSRPPGCRPRSPPPVLI